MHQPHRSIPPHLLDYLASMPRHQEELCPQACDATWRVVKPFVPDVLVDNWAEERLKYKRANYEHNSTYRHDYLPFCGPTVDEAVRRKAKLRNEWGVPYEVLFHHFGHKPHGNRITWYDEHYNRRDRGPDQKFPEERDWSLLQNAWRPEKTDYPLIGDPTNWGLLERLERRWNLERKEESDCRYPEYKSVYMKSYNKIYPPSAYTLTRYATPSVRSFSNNPVDKINKNMSYTRSNQPEILSTVRPGMTPGVCEPRHPPAILYS